MAKADEAIEGIISGNVTCHKN